MDSQVINADEITFFLTGYNKLQTKRKKNLERLVERKEDKKKSQANLKRRSEKNWPERDCIDMYSEDRTTLTN